MRLLIQIIYLFCQDAIKKPIIRTQSKLVKKEAPDMFRRIQTYMGDKGGSSGNRSSSASQLEVAVEVVSKGWIMVELRDEIFIQLCRQTTRNPQQ
jgi:Rho GTPase-activating protein 39